MKRFLRLWFYFEDPVDRKTYFLSGLFLAALKYAGDTLLVLVGTGHTWNPIEYQSSITGLLNGPLKEAPTWVLVGLIAWSIPFLWIGITMSMRRALDAGFTAWVALLFFVPGVKYLLMAALSLAPRAAAPGEGKNEARPDEARLPSAMMAIASGMLLGLVMMGVSVFALKTYGAALFLGTPFVVGVVTAWQFNRRYRASGRETQAIVLFTMASVAGVTLITAAEGAFCLLMAAPLALGLGALGSVLGRSLANFWDEPVRNMVMGVMALPLAASLDATTPATALREVRSSIEINATPEAVWRNVISFPPLPAPNELVFRAGISYPMRAEIRGEGVGAIRYCVFSTGSFVEPITRWEPGRRLSFDVTSQPKPMEEWSPYADITPPHLDGYFRSRRGEFRLIPLPGGRTRLEGSTWYEMKLQPAAYWTLFGDAFVHRIHTRVLEHIRVTAEHGR